MRGDSVIYRLFRPSTAERITVPSFADMVNRWLSEPDLVMLDVGLTPSEAQAVNNLYSQREELRATKRELARAKGECVALSAMVMRRAYSSEEGVVL
jgi:hypothetical protein